MFDMRPLSPSRRLVYDLMQRTKEDHATISATFSWDVTETEDALAAASEGRSPLTMTAYLLRCTAIVMRDNPGWNRRIFRRVAGPHLVQWNEVSCNLVMARDVDGKGEEVVFSTVLRHIDQMSVGDIQDRLDELKQGDPKKLDELKAAKNLQRIPRPVLAMANQALRFSPKFFISRFGTYGYSSLLNDSCGVTALVPICPSATFYPLALEDRPMVVNGEVVPRRVLVFAVGLDHHVVDGMTSSRGCRQLKTLVEEPERVLGEADVG